MPDPPTPQIAGLYARYALIALAAYDEPADNDDNVVFSPRVVPALAGWDNLKRDLGTVPISQALAWIDGWKRKTLKVDRIGPNGEADHKPAVGGLGVQLWYKPGDCSELIVAFRGTNFTQASDWYSNFRWITRILPGYDQYDQVRDNADDWVQQIRALCPNHAPTIVTVGHSLGGGLAQQAAYVARPFCRVYAFDPSVVTGYYSTPKSDINAKDLLIDRLYEHGEVLAYIRFFIGQVYPISDKNPAIRRVRFNFQTRGSVFDQHSMSTLAAELIRAAGHPEDWKKLPRASILAPSAMADCPARLRGAF